MEQTIESVLDNSGAWAHGDDIDRAAAEWAELGFDANDVAAWLDARCFDPQAADDLQAAGITPNDAMLRMHAPWAGYIDTLGYIYANGDCSIEQVRAALAADDEEYGGH